MNIAAPALRWILPTALLAITAAHAAAHTGQSHPPDATWWTAWSWQTLPLIGTLLAAGIYAVGLARLWRTAGPARAVAPWQAACFFAAIITLLLALVSPIDTLAGELASVHMVQHMLLMLLAAPLLVVASPGSVALWALPRTLSRPIAQAFKHAGLHLASRYLLWHPLVLWTLYAAVLAIWHLPALYGAALQNQFVHDIQHLTFVLGAALYWRVLLDPVGRVRLTPVLAVIYLFTMSLHGMLLGVFMALSPRLWYSHYDATAPAWGLTALQDQQIAGYIMWMPACGVYALIAAAIFGAWLYRSTRADERAEADAPQQQTHLADPGASPCAP